MSAYSDLKELIQLAPAASDFVIWRFWNAGSAEDNKRYIVLIENGGRSDQDIKRPTFNAYFVSKVNDSDLTGFSANVESISDYLSKNYKNNCLIGCNVIASASGPRPSTDNRFWATADLQVLYSLAAQ